MSEASTQPNNSKQKIHFWLRSEVKLNEYRTPLLPSHAKKLIDNGNIVTVEKSTSKMYSR